MCVRVHNFCSKQFKNGRISLLLLLLLLFSFHLTTTNQAKRLFSHTCIHTHLQVYATKVHRVPRYIVEYKVCLANLRWCMDVPVKFIFLHLHLATFISDKLHSPFHLCRFVCTLRCNTHFARFCSRFKLQYTHSHTRTTRAVCSCVRTFYLKLAIFVYSTHAMYIISTEVMINLCTLFVDFSLCQNGSLNIHYSRELFSDVARCTQTHAHNTSSYSLTLNKMK